MPAAVASLAQQLLTFEAHGDRAGVETWFSRYDVMPSALTQALASTRDIPVDITPEFELAHGVPSMKYILINLLYCLHRIRRHSCCWPAETHAASP